VLCGEGEIPDAEGLNLLKTLDHPYIARVFEVNQDSKNYYIITEHCGGGILFDALLNMQEFTESKAVIIMKQVLSAITYCHEKGLAHR
jgi:calcium-dependent protein kinase